MTMKHLIECFFNRRMSLIIGYKEVSVVCKDSPRLIVSSAATFTMSNSKLYFEDNNHEEADMLLFHQALLASRRNQSTS